jgi:hypothetical protein
MRAPALTGTRRCSWRRWSPPAGPAGRVGRGRAGGDRPVRPAGHAAPAAGDRPGDVDPGLGVRPADDSRRLRHATARWGRCSAWPRRRGNLRVTNALPAGHLLRVEIPASTSRLPTDAAVGAT